ncbi:MAG: site-specific DNA-methyltransferase [Synergistaceae bacterium]|nr:site-specific DNA-methyltransferase [Synergistaceae bacterium]
MDINDVILGDSVEILRSFPASSVHAIISDIPYGIGCDDWDVLHENQNTAYGGASSAQLVGGALFRRRGKPLNGWSDADKNIPQEYQNWCATWAGGWLRVLKPGGSCFVFAGRRHAHRCIVAMEEAGFTFKDMLSWEKDAAPQRAQRLSAIYERRNDEANQHKWAGWRVANLRPLFEPILWFQRPYRTGGTLADNVLENGVGAWNEMALQKYNAQSDSQTVFSNVIRVQVSHDDHGKHIAQKPLKLMELLISLVTLEGQVVLDPFMGSGTTCLAAKRLKRNYIGIDIDPENVQTAKERLNNSLQCELAL